MLEGPHAINPARPKWRRILLLGLLLCLALGLRVFHLGHQELRGDEAFDALFSAQAVDPILTQLQRDQPYPPLFHVGLHFWLDLLGQSEVTQRLPALIASVLLVPLVYQLARLMLSEGTALLAAALAAINPLYIWHAQDGRMYSLFALFSLASIWLSMRSLQGHARCGWIQPITPLGMPRWSLLTFSLGPTLQSTLALPASLVMGTRFLMGCRFREANPRFRGNSVIGSSPPPTRLSALAAHLC